MWKQNLIISVLLQIVVAYFSNKTYDSYLQQPLVGSLVEELSFIVNVVNSTVLNVTVGNEKFTMEMGSQYGTKLWWKPNENDEAVDLVGSAVGLYTSYTLTKEHDFNYTNVEVVDETATKIDVAFYAFEGELHLVLFKGLNGFYSYFVNRNLPLLGEFRTLIRLNPNIYQNGHTSIKDEALPVWPDDYKGKKVFDETWQLGNTSNYITKYDWSSRLHEEEMYGVYGSFNERNYGFWLISPGRDYYCGDQLKQELLVHRESSTGDVVLLNMLHGTHFEVEYDENFLAGKVYGPYLFYFNDGSISDANRRLKKEQLTWPYKWYNDTSYLDRSSISGRLILSTGAPAANVNLFLGPTNNYTMVQGSAYQYYGYTDEQGYFTISNIRNNHKYWLQAFNSEWGSLNTDIGTVTGNFTYEHQIDLRQDHDLGEIIWHTNNQTTLWQIGTYDRTTKGFKYGALKYQDFQTELCPGDFDFYIGNTSDYEWCYAKSKQGIWTVHFDIDEVPLSSFLYVSIAGFTGNNSIVGGNSTVLGVRINGCDMVDEYQTNLYNDKSTYRSSSFGGHWFYSKLKVECLQEGANILEFVTTDYTANYGIMWDSIQLALEW